MKNMRKQLLLWTLLATGCALFSGSTGCHSIMAATHYNYSVIVSNDSNEAIFVERFTIYEKGPNNLVAAGLVAPKKGSGTLYRQYAPKEVVTIKWKSTATEKISQATVKLVLPKEFTKKNGASIYFYIQQDQTVRVAYRIRDAKGDSRMIE